MLGVVFFNDSKSKGTIPTNSDTAIKVATSGGTVLGQLGFGYLADVVGRKRMYGLELIIIIFATLAQALSSSSRAISITGIIIFWRVLMVSLRFRGKNNKANSTRVLESVVTTHCLLLSHLSSQPPNGEVP
jgi:MFS-type transporter involved in bile tolerance (Atg22 family)